MSAPVPLRMAARLTSTGTTSSLQIIVLRATTSTMMVAVAAERPPMNTASARAG